MRATITIATTAKTPLHQRQQHHCNKGNNAITMTARTPAHWWWWQCHCNKGNNASLRMGTMQHDKGNNAIVDQGQQCHCYKGNNTILTTARMPAYWQWWQHHHHEGSNHNHNNAKMPAHWWQQCHCDKGNNASLTTSDKGNNTSLTMVETSAHWQWQQCHCDQSNNCHCDNGKDACALTAMTLAWWQSTRARTSMMTTTPLQ